MILSSSTSSEFTNKNCIIYRAMSPGCRLISASQVFILIMLAKGYPSFKIIFWLGRVHTRNKRLSKRDFISFLGLQLFIQRCGSSQLLSDIHWSKLGPTKLSKLSKAALRLLWANPLEIRMFSK